MKKKKQLPPQINFIVEQSKTMRRLGYSLAIMTFLCFGSIVPFINSKKTQEDIAPIFIFLATLFFIAMVFLIYSYSLITTRKKIIVRNNKIIIKSNKKKYSLNKDLNAIVWWRKRSAGNEGFGDEILIKFTYRRVKLNVLDFKNLYKLEQLLETKYKEREKKNFG